MPSSPLKKRSLARREVMEEETAMKAAKKLNSQNTENLVRRNKIERDTPRGASMELFNSEAEKRRKKNRIEENEKLKTPRKSVQFHKQTVVDSDHKSRNRISEPGKEKKLPIERVQLGSELEVVVDPKNRIEESEKIKTLVKSIQFQKSAVDDSDDNSRDRKSEPEKKEKLPIEEIPLGSELEVAVDSQIYDWQDRFQPRKPKYSNRVHTGYRWTRYNRTHYDRDHPPPKMVEGYEFNVYYPDLVDKTKIPGYSIEKDGDRTETCIIRFHAGPPYEDVAFRIVNDDWDYSASGGFLCEFESGVLCLCFYFKQYVYRR